MEKPKFWKKNITTIAIFRIEIEVLRKSGTETVLLRLNCAGRNEMEPCD